MMKGDGWLFLGIVILLCAALGFGFGITVETHRWLHEHYPPENSTEEG